jgi:hypothetical protein
VASQESSSGKPSFRLLLDLKFSTKSNLDLLMNFRLRDCEQGPPGQYIWLFREIGRRRVISQHKRVLLSLSVVALAHFICPRDPVVRPCVLC